MTITEADIKKLASLARIKISPEEEVQFAHEIDSILGYVEQIKEVSDTALLTTTSDASKTEPNRIPHRNILREDIPDKELNADAKVLVEGAPRSHDGFVQVKKILN